MENFAWAEAEINAGRRVRRVNWDPGVFLYIRPAPADDPEAAIHYLGQINTEMRTPYPISELDQLAEDWSSVP